MALLYKFAERALNELVGLTCTKLSDLRRWCEAADWLRQNKVESRIASGALVTGKDAYEGKGGLYDLFFTATNRDLIIDSSVDWRNRFLYMEGWISGKSSKKYLPNHDNEYVIGRYYGWKSLVSTANAHGGGNGERWNFPDKEPDSVTEHSGSSRVSTRQIYNYGSVNEPGGTIVSGVISHGRFCTFLYTGAGALWPVTKYVDSDTGGKTYQLADSSYYVTYINFNDTYAVENTATGKRVLIWAEKSGVNRGKLMARIEIVEDFSGKLPYNNEDDADVCMKCFFSPVLV